MNCSEKLRSIPRFVIIIVILHCFYVKAASEYSWLITIDSDKRFPVICENSRIQCTRSFLVSLTRNRVVENVSSPLQKFSNLTLYFRREKGSPGEKRTALPSNSAKDTQWPSKLDGNSRWERSTRFSDPRAFHMTRQRLTADPFLIIPFTRDHFFAPREI